MATVDHKGSSQTRSVCDIATLPRMEPTLCPSINLPGTHLNPSRISRKLPQRVKFARSAKVSANGPRYIPLVFISVRAACPNGHLASGVHIPTAELLIQRGEHGRRHRSFR